jgi:single-stranded DNA-specific DHH superfamily exonuclease
LSPAGKEITAPARPRADNTLVKALARAFRWRKFLETGAYATVAEMADAEGINRSYVSRVLRLTLLAPEIIESILDGQVRTEMIMPDLLEPRSELWKEQKLSKAD